MAITLFKEGAHITDVSIQYNGGVAIGSGGVGGEYYTIIAAEDRPHLLSALAEACGRSIPDDAADESTGVITLALFEELFGEAETDPYVDIKNFLTEQGVRFKGSYWPSR